MSRYELYNEKQAEFLGFYNGSRLLEKGEIIIFQGEKFFLSELITSSEGYSRANVWPTIINLQIDNENPRLLSWLRKNLTGMTVKLKGDKRCVRGKVINYWPGMRNTPAGDSDNLKNLPDKLVYEMVPRRIELLTLQADDLRLMDLTDFHTIELLGKDRDRP